MQGCTPEWKQLQEIQKGVKTEYGNSGPKNFVQPPFKISGYAPGKNVHQVLVNCLGGLPRNSVVRVSNRTRNNLMLKGCKTEIKPKPKQKEVCLR